MTQTFTSADKLRCTRWEMRRCRSAANGQGIPQTREELIARCSEGLPSGFVTCVAGDAALQLRQSLLVKSSEQLLSGGSINVEQNPGHCIIRATQHLERDHGRSMLLGQSEIRHSATPTLTYRWSVCPHPYQEVCAALSPIRHRGPRSMVRRVAAWEPLHARTACVGGDR